MNLLIKIIGTKFNAIMTFIRNCLCTPRVMIPKVHTGNVMPATNIDGTELNDKIINKPMIFKSII